MASKVGFMLFCHSVPNGSSLWLSVIAGVRKVFLFVVPLPIFIIVFVVIAIGKRGGVNDVLGEGQFRFIDLKVRYVLAIVGLSLFLFVVYTFTALTILVPRFLTIAAGLGGAIA